jgi:DNA-binding winged helix-turn-helix (wHTH) protein
VQPGKDIRFGEFVLEVRPYAVPPRRLRHMQGREVLVPSLKGHQLPVAARALEVLEYLAVNYGVVSRSSLLRKVWGGQQPEASSVDQQIRTLRAAFGDRDANRNRTISNEYKRGFRLVPEPQITLVDNDEIEGVEVPAPTPVIMPLRELPALGGRSFPCIHIDSDHAAMIHLITQYQREDLHFVYDTFVRLKPQDPRYSADRINAYVDAVASFIDRATENWGPNKYLHEVFGGYVESYFLERLALAAKRSLPRDKAAKHVKTTNRVKISSRESSIVFSWLKNDRSPIMNFIILEYKDGESEVLFGWGRHIANEPNEGVFLSTHRELVAEFRRFYDVLESDVSVQLRSHHIMQKAKQNRRSEERLLKGDAVVHKRARTNSRRQKPKRKHYQG